MRRGDRFSSLHPASWESMEYIVDEDGLIMMISHERPNNDIRWAKGDDLPDALLDHFAAQRLLHLPAESKSGSLVFDAERNQLMTYGSTGFEAVTPEASWPSTEEWDEINRIIGESDIEEWKAGRELLNREGEAIIALYESYRQRIAKHHVHGKSIHADVTTNDLIKIELSDFDVQDRVRQHFDHRIVK
jgi:hypothetical protein